MLSKSTIISVATAVALTATVGTANAGFPRIANIGSLVGEPHVTTVGYKICLTTSCAVREKIKAENKRKNKKYCDRNIRDHRKPRRNAKGEYIYQTPKGGRCINDHRTKKRVRDHRSSATVKDHRIRTKVTGHRTKTKVLDHREKTKVIDHRDKTSVKDHRGKTTVKIKRRKKTVVRARRGHPR